MLQGKRGGKRSNQKSIDNYWLSSIRIRNFKAVFVREWLKKFTNLELAHKLGQTRKKCTVAFTTPAIERQRCQGRLSSFKRGGSARYIIVENSAWQQWSGCILAWTNLSKIRVTSTIASLPHTGQERGETIASNLVNKELALSFMSGSLISSNTVILSSSWRFIFIMRAYFYLMFRVLNYRIWYTNAIWWKAR